jgi:peroxiredoxin
MNYLSWPYKLLVFTSFYAFTISCDRNATVEGDIDYLGNADLIIQEQPIHYKYAPVHSDTLHVNEDGNFSTSLAVHKGKLYDLKIGDAAYPLVLTPSQRLTIHIKRSDFPKSVLVDGYPKDWDVALDEYFKKIEPIDAQILIEEQKMIEGKANTVLQLSRRKYQLSQKYLADTPFHSYYLKDVGAYLVFKIRAIEYHLKYVESFNADSARKSLIQEAQKFNFFTVESLKAQRAGIRDFTHYYARTFGIYDSLKAAYGQDLSEYDIKRLAYHELNEKRLEVLKYIPNRDALAHAKMYLIAERIGEQSIEISTPSYLHYVEEFSDYPEYTSFLTHFYTQIQSVSPGQPAIPFTLFDSLGQPHRMNDYQGSYVLLDFWAGWCQPCLDEFSAMKELYKKYSRDELEIIGISTEVDSLLWRKDIARFKLPWPQLYGGNGFNQKTFKAYKGGGIPFYILVNPDGNIARYNDIRPSFNVSAVLDSLLSTRKNRVN